MSSAETFQAHVLSVHPGAEANPKGRDWRIVDGERSLGLGETPDRAWEAASARLHREFVQSRHPAARAERKGLSHVTIYDGRSFLGSGVGETNAWARVAESLREAEEDAAPDGEPPAPPPGPRA